MILHLEGSVRSQQAGAHRSRKLGGGGEFAEFAEYRPGDDLRRIDWKVAARTDRYVVRRHESERRAHVQIILDSSGSMGFGTSSELPAPWGGHQPGTKWSLACLAGLLLGFIARQRGDRVRFALTGESAPELAPVDGRGLAGLSAVASQLTTVDPHGEAGLHWTLRRSGGASGSSLFVYIGDLLDEVDGVEQLAQLRAAGAEVWVLQILDPAELDFPYEEPIRFVGLECADELPMNPRDYAEEIRREMADFCASREAACRHAGLRYCLLRADGRWDQKLIELVEGG